MLLTVWTLLVRLIVVRFATSKTLSTYDRSLVAIMVPKGLAAAVLASLVLQSGVTGAETIREVSFGVILFSICLVAVLTFVLERGWLDRFFRYIYGNSHVLKPSADQLVTGPFSHVEAIESASKKHSKSDSDLDGTIGPGTSGPSIAGPGG